MALPHVFSTLTGAQPPSKLDENFSAVSGTAGSITSSTPVVINLSSLDRVGKPWVLSVTPGASSTVLVESSTNGGTSYSSVGTVTDSTGFMGEAGDEVDRVRLTCTTGSSTGFWSIA